MKASVEWIDLMRLVDIDYFVVSSNLYQFQKKVSALGERMEGATHTSRRYEYPWAYLKATKGKRCLDAGGGTNPLSFALIGFYEEIIVLDIDTAALENLKRILTKIPCNIKPVEGDLRNMSYPDEYFDDTFCISVLEHGPINPDVVTAVKELLRVTKRKLFLTMDVGEHGLLSGPLGLQQMNDLLEYLHVDSMGTQTVDCFQLPESREPYTIACIMIDKEET